MNIKKSLIVAGVAMIAGISIVGAQGYSFNTNLLVGSTGQDVVQLQTMLINSGFHIPAIESNEAVKGTFGSQTKTAVKLYQSSKGIPNTGFVGPLTRATLNAGGGSSYVSPVAMVCPAGYTCTANPGVPTTPNIMAPVGSITTPGIAGTLSVTLQGSPSGASLDKGETEDVARYKLQAASSDMQVTSISFDVDTRLWLIAGSITIKDDSGAVVAQKSGLTASDFTELTVGTSYRLHIPVNYVVPKIVSRYLTVSISMLPVSDRSSATVTIDQVQVRSVDGTGVSNTQTEGTNRTFTYTGSNSSQVVITLNNQSLPNMLIPISVSAETDNVVMGVANFRSNNKDGVMRSASLYIFTNGTAPADIFSDVRIQSGNLAYSADSIANGNLGNLTNFTNMAIPLPKDKDVPIAVVVRVKKNTSNSLNGVAASTTLSASGTAGGTSNNPVVEDASYNTIDINDADIATSDLTFSSSDANLFSVPPTATLGDVTMGNVGGVSASVARDMAFTYTLTAGDNPLYVAAAPTTALSTTSTGYATAANASSTLTSLTVTPSEVAGDDTASTPTYYIVPAGGSRTFRWAGSMRNDPPRGTILRTFKISAIKYGTTSSNLNANTVIYYDYDALKVQTAI